MPTIYKEVEVDVELSDFSDEELLEEIERREICLDTNINDSRERVNTMYEKFRQGKNIDSELREFFWSSIGRIV